MMIQSKKRNASLPRYICILLINIIFNSFCLATENRQNPEKIMFNHSPELKLKLQTAYAAKGSGYEPRTHHLDEQNQAVYINRLILEDSPYLLQHAHNPVDWYPWRQEAFEQARKENKPVFLSIGYSTCHWCHVMEVESFEDENIARYMNEHFISIKVDRELLPDIDTIYMTAIMMMNGQGGWPMSSFLTADGKPFFGGTYFPPQQFFTLLQQVHDTWNKKNAEILEQANLISNEINRVMQAKQQATTITNETIEKALNNVVSSFDKTNGGFGQAPKFPHEPNLFLLLEAAILLNDESIITVLNETLQMMAQGGIYDHVGGGFHRYSTDQHWLVPHFEKMLYNQANLSRIYARAYEITGIEFYKQVLTETLDYILREMTNDDGGFYSATDADSEDREGAFFVWKRSELKNTLSEKEYQLSVDLFAISEQGNFEGRNILFLPESYATYAEKNNLEISALLNKVLTIKQKLLDVRNKRIPPLRDNKIITAWNGMMISAFSAAGKILGRKDYSQAAINTANYILDKNRQNDGSLWRASLNGHPSINGKQEDYAFLAEALIQLYDDSHDEHWLNEAENITKIMLDKFWDTENGGFFMNIEEPEVRLPTRPKELDDNAVPSGNSVALRVLAKLAKRTGKEDYNNRAEALIASFSETIDKYPHAYTYLQTGLLEFLNHEHSNQQYSAKGNIRLDSTINQDKKFIITINIKPKWHINAHKPLSEDLIPSKLSIDETTAWELTEVNYPEPSIEFLSFSKDKLALYKDTITITGKLKRKTVAEKQGALRLIKLNLQLQACNNDTCLAPETVPVFISI